MKNQNQIFITIIMTFLCVSASYSQHHDQSSSKEEHEFRHHAIGGMIGHAHVMAGGHETEQTDFLVVPTWGLGYNYWFNEKWAAGINAELETQSYVINNSEVVDLVRQYPLKLALIAVFRPVGGLILFAGPGWELEKHKNFAIFKIGIGYEFELPGHWFLAPELAYDSREGKFGSMGFGLVVGKRLARK